VERERFDEVDVGAGLQSDDSVNDLVDRIGTSTSTISHPAAQRRSDRASRPSARVGWPSPERRERMSCCCPVDPSCLIVFARNTQSAAKSASTSAKTTVMPPVFGDHDVGSMWRASRGKPSAIIYIPL
jgi:hypothetical protein